MLLLVVLGGAALGAFGGLVVATLVNANCDSFVEQAQGCTRANVGPTVTIGLVAGLVAGFVVVAWLQRRRAGRP